MSSLRLSGLVSGVSTDELIRKILNVERTRIDSKKLEKAVIQEKKGAWDKVRSSLEGLRSALDNVRLVSNFQTRSVTTSDKDVATATASSGATQTTHTLTVNNLAQTHVVASANFDSANTAVITAAQAGNLTINNKVIAVDDTDTLNSLRDKINNTADINATAEVVKVQVDGVDKYRLVLTSKQMGAAGAVAISDDNADTLTTALGLNKVNGTYVNEVSQARDAAFNLNGIDYTSASNTISDVIPKLSIKLKEAGSTTLTVSQDTDKVVSTVKNWVDAVNSTMSLLSDMTRYDSDTKTQGALSGDYLARNIQTRIRRQLSSVVPGLPTDLNQLSQVGVTTGAYGTSDYGKVVMDEAKLKEALEANADGVARVFGALRKNVALATEGSTASASSTAAGSYDPAWTINGDSDAERFGHNGGGWQSGAAPTTDTPQTLTVTLGATTSIDQIEIWQPSTDSIDPSTSGLKNYLLEYQDSQGAWQELKSVEKHVGAYTVHDFDAVEAQAVRISVTATYGTDNPVRITEFRANQVNNGVGVDMYKYVKSSLEASTGPIDSRNELYTDQIKDLDDSISKLNDQMSKREETLRQMFNRMEQALSKLNAQGNALAGQLLALQNAVKR